MAGACTCQTAQLAKPLGALEPPMAELLNTFAAPSPAERIVVRERILQIAEDGSQLDNEIERVEKILASLRRNRAALHKLSDGHQNVLNLTRRLPIEIFGEIFIQLQCMLGGRSISPTRVCRQWREVAIATSKLWNNLNIRYNGRTALADAEMIPIWFQRSGGQPLHIMIGCHLVPGFVDTQRENPVFDAMVHDETYRWKEVKLVVTKDIMPFLNNIPEHLPKLYSLSIDADGSHFDGFRPPGHDTGITTLNNFRHAAALRVLTLGRRITPEFPEFPWAQLTTCTLLRGGSYTCADGYFVLAQAVNLQFYKMEVDATSSFYPTPPSTNIHHVNLLSLQIEIIAGANSRDLFNRLTLPALIELKLRVSGFLTDYTPESLTPLVTRSGCSLMRLSLGTRRNPFNKDQLLNLFNATPMLTELKLQYDAAAGVDDVLMDLLTHHPKHDAGPCCLLPQLVNIQLSVHEAFSYEKFAALLASRYYGHNDCSSGGWARGGLARIRTAVLIPWAHTTASGRLADRLPEETYKELIALRDSGLNLHVTVEYYGNDSRCPLEAYFSTGDEEDDSTSEEGEGDGSDVDEGDGSEHDSDYD